MKNSVSRVRLLLMSVPLCSDVRFLKNRKAGTDAGISYVHFGTVWYSNALFQILFTVHLFLDCTKGRSAVPSAQPTIHPTIHPANRRTIQPSIHPTTEECNRRTQDPSTNHTIDPSNRGPRLPSDQTLDTTTRSTVPLALQRRNINSVDYQRLLYT